MGFASEDNVFSHTHLSHYAQVVFEGYPDHFGFEDLSTDVILET
ncbi:MAG: hypothetical protein Kow0077_22900 [Anaerolineae bacterium]